MVVDLTKLERLLWKPIVSAATAKIYAKPSILDKPCDEHGVPSKLQITIARREQRIKWKPEHQLVLMQSLEVDKNDVNSRWRKKGETFQQSNA